MFSKKVKKTLKLTFLRKGEEVPCEFVIEKVDDPAEDIRIKALLKLTNS